MYSQFNLCTLIHVCVYVHMWSKEATTQAFITYKDSFPSASRYVGVNSHRELQGWGHEARLRGCERCQSQKSYPLSGDGGNVLWPEWLREPPLDAWPLEGVKDFLATFGDVLCGIRGKFLTMVMISLPCTFLVFLLHAFHRQCSNHSYKPHDRWPLAFSPKNRFFFCRPWLLSGLKISDSMN